MVDSSTKSAVIWKNHCPNVPIDIDFKMTERMVTDLGNTMNYWKACEEDPWYNSWSIYRPTEMDIQQILTALRFLLVTL